MRLRKAIVAIAIGLLSIFVVAENAAAGIVAPAHTFYGPSLGKFDKTSVVAEFTPQALPTVGRLRFGFALRKDHDSDVYARASVDVKGSLAVQIVDASGRTVKSVDLNKTIKAGQTVVVEASLDKGSAATGRIKAWVKGENAPGWQISYAKLNTGAESGTVHVYHYLSGGGSGLINVTVANVAVSNSKSEQAAPAPAPEPSKQPAEEPAAPAPAPQGPGVPAGTSLQDMDGSEDGTDDGVLSLHSDRTPELMTLKGKRIKARVEVLKGNALIENSLITVPGGAPSTHTAVLRLGHDYAHQAKLVVKNSTLEWSNNLKADQTNTANVIGLKGANITAQGIEIRNVSDGVNIDGDNFVLKDSLVHKSVSSVDSRQRDGQAHNDGVQISGGTNIVLSGNTIKGYRYSAMMIVTDRTDIRNLKVENNFLDNGSCTINARAKSGRKIDNITIKSNTFGAGQSVTPGGSWGCHKLDKPTHGMLTQVNNAKVSNNKNKDGATVYIRDAGAKKYLG